MLVSSDTQDKPSVPVPDELPPTYDASAASSSSTQTRFPLPADLQPSNLLRLSANDHNINQNFIIDPTLKIPASLLPPLDPEDETEETEATRANLRLHSKHSYVKAEVWISPSNDYDSGTTKAPAPVRINAISSYSYITLKLHDNAHLFPLRIKCDAPHSTVKVYLPQTFKGIIQASTKHGRVQFSPGVTKLGTMLGDIDSTRRMFIGDLSQYDDEEGRAKLDEAELSSHHSNVYVYMEDEVPPPASPSSSGFMQSVKRWFGKEGGPSTPDPSQTGQNAALQSGSPASGDTKVQP